MTDDAEEDAAQAEEEDGAGSGTWRPDLHWLTEHVAVGGCFPIERAAVLAREHGIRAIVDLRQEERDDVAALRSARIDFLHLPTPDLEPATTEMLERGVAFARKYIDRRERVLLHCQHGIGRSALLGLCVLVDQGWEPLHALRQAKNQRERVSPSRLQYEGWAEWLRARGIAAPDFHTFGCIAYRHLANG